MSSPAVLVLEDGTVYEGYSFGAEEFAVHSPVIGKARERSINTWLRVGFQAYMALIREP
jgi:hypothetical protein